MPNGPPVGDLSLGIFQTQPQSRGAWHEWTSSLPPDKYEVTLTYAHIAISAKILTDVPALLTWSLQNLSPFASSPTFIYSTGPWTKDNLVTAVEFFFQRNAYHPSPSAAILRSIVIRFRLPRFYRKVLERPSPTAECSTTAHTKRAPAWTQTIFVLIEKK